MPAARGILRSEQNAVNPPPEVLLAQILGSFGHKFGWVFHKFTENGELYIKWFHSLRGKNRDAYPHRPVQWSMYIPSMSTIVCPLLAAWPSNCRVLDQSRWGIQVILVMSVILWHEKTKIQKIIGCGNFNVFSVKTIIHNNIKKMGHLIWSLGVQLHAISWKWDVTRWHKAGWMIVVTCQTLFFCHKGTISAQ